MSGFTFSGSIPATYDADMGPVIFEPYAVETASRLQAIGGTRWLEVAAGTGRVTRHLADALPAGGGLAATDLNADMLEVAKSKITDSRVRFEVADATALPFEDDAFDAVVSQFGVMFYPDREAGHREARRVLRPGGTYLCASWGGYAENVWAATVLEVVAESFQGDPPGFYRVPFSYHDEAEIEASLRRAGFDEVRIERVAKPLVAEASAFARGAVRGNPLGSEIVARGGDPEAVIDRLTRTFQARFGDGPMRSELTAVIATAR